MLNPCYWFSSDPVPCRKNCEKSNSPIWKYCNYGKKHIDHKRGNEEKIRIAKAIVAAILNKIYEEVDDNEEVMEKIKEIDINSIVDKL